MWNHEAIGMYYILYISGVHIIQNLFNMQGASHWMSPVIVITVSVSRGHPIERPSAPWDFIPERIWLVSKWQDRNELEKFEKVGLS